MGWMARRWWLLALARSSREGVGGEIVQWGPAGKEIWVWLFWRLWLRVSFVPVRWGP